MMEAPSMVHRSGDKLIIRSVVSGDQLYLGHSALNNSEKHTREKLNLSDYHDPTNDGIEEIIDNNNLQSPHDKKDDDTNLPQCKIKRNYSCNNCNFFTQNPRHFLAHLRDIHGEKIIINECKHCLYASRHYQKLVRHMKMVHGSTDGLEEQAQSRKRASQLAREEKKRKLQLISNVGNSVHVNLNDSISAIQTSSNASSPGMVSSKQQLQAIASASVSGSQSNSINESTANQMNAEVLNQKFLKCTLCEFTTLYRTQMVEHEREEHNKTKFFRCQKCSYVTHIKARFSKHVKYHSMPMIKCVMCDFRTPYKWNLDRHMKNHGGAGPFKCSGCNFTADIKQSLTVHEMNHHNPPIGTHGHPTGMSMARRRNKVGGTDLMDAEYGIMNMGDYSDGGEGHPTGMSMTRRRNKVGGTDLMDAEYGIMHMDDNSDGGDGMDNNNSDNDNFDASDVSKRAKYENDLIEEYQSIAADLSQKSKTPAPTPPPKKSVRPLPNLIPIQPMTSSDAMNLSVRNKNECGEKIWGSIENLFETEISKSKKRESVLKDLASLFVSEEVFDGSETSQLSPVSNASSAKRKNTNFFNELKEKFATGSRDMMCLCGHTSSTLSEAIIHKKSCGKTAEKQGISPVNLIINNLGSSTRCQYCRHRCKTSADLYNHLQSCAEARTSAESCDSASEIDSNNEKVDVSGELTDEGMIDLTNEPHPMENKVFVWNKLPQPSSLNTVQNQVDPKALSDTQHEPIVQIDEGENNDDEKADENTYYGIETAPGYGEVTKKMNPNDEAMQTSLKKVFKCPHCSFWASTASRFHVHIVGHLNKKPFECSLCSYRSNWRWDITKHIRLKTIRDASHKSAKVLMNDETGRRNYTKYNKYITLMKVTDEDGDPKNMKSGEMTPSQEASLQKRKVDSDNDDDKPSLAQNALLYSISNNQFNSCADNDNDNDKQNDNDSNTKKVSFKCKKCNFRHNNRDVVLAHVKGHYKDANISIDEQANNAAANAAAAAVAAAAGLTITNASEFNNNVYVNGILSALTPSASKLLIQHPQLAQQAADQTLPQIRIQALNQLSGNSSHLFLADLTKQQQHQQQPIPSINTQNVNVNANQSSIALQTPANASQNQSNPSSTTTNENGEMDEASSGLNSVNGWRGAAPYRCGHCHQVSNWKHVIQRHCRLKHDGDIQIEIKIKGSKDAYQPLALHGSNSMPITSMAPTTIAGAGVAAAAAPTSPPLSSSTNNASLSMGSAGTSSSASGLEKESLSYLTKISPIKLPVLSDATKSAANPKSDEVSLIETSINAMDTDQRNLLINLLASQTIMQNGKILCPVINLNEFRCNLCNFEALNQAHLTQHYQIHLGNEPNLISLITGTSEKNTTLDLDDAITTSKVLKKAFNRTSESSDTDANQSQINSKHLQKIVERQILSNGKQNDKTTAEKVNREENCPHCPFSTNKSDVLKEHMMCHICVSGRVNLANCNFCDFSIADETLLPEHSRIHFGLIRSSKQKPVAFYTSYENLEITTIDQQNNNNNINNNNNSSSGGGGDNNNDTSHQNPYANVKTLYPKINFDLQYSSDKENKILVDTDTGHIIK